MRQAGGQGARGIDGTSQGHNEYGELSHHFVFCGAEVKIGAFSPPHLRAPAPTVTVRLNQFRQKLADNRLHEPIFQEECIMTLGTAQFNLCHRAPGFAQTGG